MKDLKLDLLGSTGSIGEQALDVVDKYGMRIRSICAGTNEKRVEEQVRKYKPAFCAMADIEAARSLAIRLADTDTKVYAGPDGICEMIGESDATVALNAIVGQAGLAPTLAVIEAGKQLALANKESLVVAGEVVMQRAKERGVSIIPVDSEHCAIHQCLRAGKKEEVKRLILTASGGPFFGKKREELENVSAAEALAHPTWSMGAKITVDSATLMNKGFELIEASHLFGVDMGRISAVVHRESIIHSMVEYIDNSVIAQMSVPNMRSCIQYGIGAGARPDAVIEPLDLVKVGNLSFYEPDMETFPLLGCAISCGKAGGALPAILNAANEVAVDAFLKDTIPFGGIDRVVISTVERYSQLAAVSSLDEILEADREARRYAAERCLQKGLLNE